MINILGQKDEILLVRQVLHAKLMHVLHQRPILNRRLVLLLDRVLAVVCNSQGCAPLVPERALEHVILLLIRQRLVDQRLQILVSIHRGQDCLSFILICFRRYRSHCNNHRFGRKQWTVIDLDALQLGQELLKGQESCQFEHLHGQAKDLYEVFDRLAAHLLLLLCEQIEKECQAHVSAGLLADVQDQVSDGRECLTEDVGQGLDDVLPELAIPHVLEHATENLMHVLRRLVLHILGPELADVLDLEGRQPRVALHVRTCDIDALDEEFLSLRVCSCLQNG